MIDINDLRQSLGAVQPEEVSELLDRLEAAERERDDVAQQLVQAEIGKRKIDAECDALRAKVERMEKREPVGVMYVGSYYGYELPEWEFDVDQGACDKLNEAYVNNPTTLKLYAIPDTKGE